jgi:hypothetical protein
VLWDMTIGPCLTTGGVIGVIMIVIGFYLWFFLSKSNINTFDLNTVLTALVSNCHFGLYGGHKCHVALSPTGVG